MTLSYNKMMFQYVLRLDLLMYIRMLSRQKERNTWTFIRHSSVMGIRQSSDIDAELSLLDEFLIRSWYFRKYKVFFPEVRNENHSENR